jgi:hypothetical protein
LAVTKFAAATPPKPEAKADVTPDTEADVTEPEAECVPGVCGGHSERGESEDSVDGVVDTE